MGSNRYGGGVGVQSFEDMERELEFVEERQVLQYAEAKLGVQIEDWAASPVGRFVVGSAKQEISAFMDWALSQDARAEEFEQRRAKALAARTLVQWFSEQVLAGLSAEKQLRASEQG